MKLDKQKIKLYSLSLIILMTMTGALAIVSTTKIRNSYFHSLEAQAVTYQMDIVAILYKYISELSYFVEASILAGAATGVDLSDREFDQASFGEFVNKNWAKVEIFWGIENYHYFVLKDGRLELAYKSTGVTNVPDEFVYSLSERSLNKPHYDVFCGEICTVFSASPILFSNKSKGILVFSSPLENLFFDFTKETRTDVGLVRSGSDGAKGENKFELFFSNNYRLSDEVLGRISQKGMDFFSKPKSSELPTVGAVSNDDKHYAAFLIPLPNYENAENVVSVLVMKDMSQHYIKQKSIMFDNMIAYLSVIIIGGVGLAAFYWVGTSKKMRLLALSNQSQLKIIEEKVLIITFDSEGNISKTSKALMDRMALVPGRIHRIGDVFVKSADGQEAINQLMQSIQKSEAWTQELSFEVAEGETISLVGRLGAADPLANLEDHHAILFEDVTDKNRIKHYFEELKKLDRFRRELIAHVSHDLRTPLTTLRGYLESCLIDLGEGDISNLSRMLNTAVNSSDQLGRLIEQLFELSQLNDSNANINLEPVAIVELIYDVVMNFKLSAKEKGISISVSPLDTAITVLADIKKVERVFINLIGNAIRYCGKGDSIQVLLEDDGSESVLIKVVDTGVGIKESDLSNIFNSYYQSGCDLNRTNLNKGLGLAITKKIIDLHDSDIRVTSILGEGTCFTFSLKSA